MKCKCREEKKIVIERNSTWKERKSTAQVKKAVKIKVAKNKKRMKRRRIKARNLKLRSGRITHSRIFTAGTPYKSGYEELSF